MILKDINKTIKKGNDVYMRDCRPKVQNDLPDHVEVQPNDALLINSDQILEEYSVQLAYASTDLFLT